MADLEDVTLDGRPLQSLRVADLKAALEERGLSKSGQKNALIKRLKGALMLENLQRTSTAHIGLQPNSQIGEEMSQNSFIKQYLAKQQELLRQRLEREAREAYETNEQEDHKDVNNSTSCPPPAQDVTPSGQHKPPGPSEGEGLFGSVNAGQDNRNQEADVSSPPASGSVAMRVPGGEQRSERGSASSEVAGDSDDEDSEGGDDDDWGGGAPRRNLREPPRVPAVRERAGAPRQPQQQHIPSLLSPQLRQPTPPPSPPPELSFPLPDTPKQSPPSPPAAPARHSPSSSSSGSSSSGSRSSSPEPQRSGHVERKPGPLSLLVRKMESEEAYSGPGWHGTDGEGDRQDSSSPSAMLFPGRGPPGGLVSAISHTANTASHVPFPMIPHTHQGVTHLAPSQLPVSVLKATAAEERDRERESELERERELELERQEKLRQLEEERAAEEAKQRAIALEREERERALERERFERQQALEREEREKALQREQELALERERREREEALAREREERERAMELERQKELERQRALEEERLRREREEKEKREREEMEKALEQERIKRERALEQERLERERALEAERREKERIEREKALEQERLEKERIEREKALELARIEKEKAMEKERIDKERALEQERIEREKAAELERIEREKALEQERREREKALEQEKLELERKEKERIEREKALEQERIERERREREEKEKAEKEAALEKERERAEKERKEQMEREKALEQEKLEKAKAQEKERKEKERALEQEKERALKQERLEREKAVQKEKEELEKEKLKMAETKIGIHLPPSKRSHELNLTSQSKPSVLSSGPAQKALGDAKQEDIHAPASQSEAQTSESNAAPQSPHSSFKKFRFLRESPVQAQPSSTSLVIKRPRTFSDSPQPRTLHVISPTTAGDRQQSTTEQEHPQVPKSLEVSAATAGSAETQSEKTAALDQSSKEEAREQAVSPQTEESVKESIKSAKELDERKDSSSPVDASEQRGRDAKKNEKRSRRRSSSNDSSSSESDSGSSSSQSSGSSTSSQDKTRTSSRRRDEEKCKRDSSPLRVETAEADTEAVKRSPQASHREKETPTERSNTAAGDVHTMKQVTEDRAREDPHRKRKFSEGDEEKEKQRRVTETVMADPEKLSETSEETPKAFSARKISLGSSKSSPGTGSGEGEQESGPVAGRKRRWGSSTAVTAKKPSISITTDSLKSLIPDIRPTLAQEPVVDLHPEEAVLSGGEDEDQERPDQNLQIRRTVTQVVHAEENGQKEAKRSRSEELEEDDSQGDREIMKSPEEQMDASLPVETQSPTHTSQDAEINTVTPSETLIRRSISQQKTGVSITIDDPVRTARQPSPPRGKVSNIVHICNLVRPFTLGQLKELLSRTGTLVEDGFWIDKIKSHCYVTYASLEEAVATRGALHGVKWPQSNPKVLRVDFCEQDELDFHKGLGAAEKPGGEEAGPPSGRGRTSGLPSLLPERNQWAEREREMERRERARAEREWDRDKVKEFGKPAEEKDGGPRRSRSRERRRKERGKSKEKKTEKKSEDPPAKLLDDLFLKTKAAPCIYWLPLTEEQYVQRQAALAEQKKEREERRKEREKQRKEQEEEEEKKREEERKERMKAAGATTGDRSEGEKDKDRDRERDRDRGRDRDRDRDRERDRERERERERENDKRRDGYRRPGGSSARRSRSRSEPRERRR